VAGRPLLVLLCGPLALRQPTSSCRLLLGCLIVKEDSGPSRNSWHRRVGVSGAHTSAGKDEGDREQPARVGSVGEGLGAGAGMGRVRVGVQVQVQLGT